MHTRWDVLRQVVLTVLIIASIVIGGVLFGIKPSALALATSVHVVFPTPAPRTPVGTPSIPPLFRPDQNYVVPSVTPTGIPSVPYAPPPSEPTVAPAIPEPEIEETLPMSETTQVEPDIGTTVPMSDTSQVSDVPQTFSFVHDSPAWYAPMESDVIAVIIPAGTSYRPIARYREEWVHADVPSYGQLWVRCDDIGPDIPISLINALPNLAPVRTYRAYVVQPGDTLHSIALRGGSDAAMIGSLNHVQEPLRPGRPVVIPVFEGKQTSLPLFPSIFSRGSVEQPRVALTVDLEVGDDRVWYLLDVLRERKTRITFFVLGWWVQQHPDIVRQMVADGHEIANHSLSHPDFRTLSNDQIHWQLAETERLVQEVAGVTTRPFFRPTYGAYNDRVLMAVIESGYLPVYWTIDTRDAVGAPKTAGFVADHATWSIAPEHLPGTIILTHCCGNRHPLPDALPTMLDRFAAMGIEVGTVSEVLGE